MTTVVGTPTLMVADSRVTYGDLCTTQDKIIRIRGLLVATAGDAGLGDQFTDYLKRKGARRPKFTDKDEFEALIISRQGLFRVDYSCRPRKLKQLFDAIGSGSFAALGALHLGATPQQAVEVACKVDSANSALPLQVVKL